MRYEQKKGYADRCTGRHGYIDYAVDTDHK